MAVQIKQMYVYVGADTMQEVAIKCVADIAGSLGGKYFLFHSTAGSKEYCWFDTGVSVDPAPAGGWTGHKVTITNGASATSVASAAATVLTAVIGFTATASNDVVTLKSATIGYCQPPRDTEDAMKKTNFSFQTTVLGQQKLSVGCIQGDIDFSGIDINKVEVKCHATGSIVQQEIPIGVSKPEIKFVLQDTSKDQVERIFNQLGYGSLTGIGADYGRVFGFGTSIVGSDIPRLPVTFHPVSLDASNKSEDWNFWKTSISIDSFKFASEAVATIPVKFAIYPDNSKHKSINLIMLGDAAKAVSA